MEETTLKKLIFYGRHFSDLLNLCCRIVDTQERRFLADRVLNLEDGKLTEY